MRVSSFPKRKERNEKKNMMKALEVSSSFSKWGKKQCGESDKYLQ